MIGNYISLAVKNLRKQKVFSIVNIIGLTVGITCCLMILMYVVHEFSYDNFHSKGKDIYRVMRVADMNGTEKNIPYVSAAYGPALENDFHEAVEQSVRIMQDNDLVSVGNISFNQKNIFLTDANFFTVFDFKLIAGDPATVLSKPNSVVLTQSSSVKYFGNENPLGRTLTLNKEDLLTVTGVAADVPPNSHLQFEMVIPIEILRAAHPQFFTNFPDNTLFTYVQLKKGITPEQIKGQFPAFMDKYLGEYYKSVGYKMGLKLAPLKDIYFASDEFDQVRHGNKSVVYIFLCIAILILLIACINFINLSTARATGRAREVGVRKVLGAVKSQLMTQFIFESILYAALSCLLSLVLVYFLTPLLNEYFELEMHGLWMSPYLYLFVLAIIISVGILSGSYPALLMSSFRPVVALKGKLFTGHQRSFLRKGLVVFQFTISVVLIIMVIGMMWQMKYMRDKNLGFENDQSLIVRIDNSTLYANKEFFKNEMRAISAVKSVSLMSGEPGGFFDTYSFAVENKPDEKLRFNTEYTDFDFVKTLGLKIIAGRDFSDAHRTDSLKAVIINRNAAKTLGYTPEQAVGKWIQNVNRDSVPRTIVGVVEDFHYTSLRSEIGALVIAPGNDKRLALIKLHTNDLPATIQQIEKKYARVAPGYPFEYTFLDEQFGRMYRKEASQELMLSLFSFVAIFIASLGLFGLSSYTAVKRTKEIGVRKVLGSSVKNIVILLTGDLLKPVLIGTLIAVPLGYYLIDTWLQGFAYRAHIGVLVFALAVFTAVCIALITISFQAIKAALANPVKSLRTE